MAEAHEPPTVKKRPNAHVFAGSPSTDQQDTRRDGSENHRGKKRLVRTTTGFMVRTVRTNVQETLDLRCSKYY